MHKAIVKTFSFLEVIRGRQRSLEGQTLDLLLLVYSWGSQLSFDMHKAIVNFHYNVNEAKCLKVVIYSRDISPHPRCNLPQMSENNPGEGGGTVLPVNNNKQICIWYISSYCSPSYSSFCTHNKLPSRNGAQLG